MKPLMLPGIVQGGIIGAQRGAQKRSDIKPYSGIVKRNVGNLTYHFAVRKNPYEYEFIVTKVVENDVMLKFAEMGPANSLFTFREILKDGVFLSRFMNVMSLEEIFSIGQTQPFDPVHGLVLAKDMFDGLSSLHAAGLRRNEFNEGDILLTERNNTFYFQIAGLETCTCIGITEPNEAPERNSCAKVLEYVLNNIGQRNKVSELQVLKSLKKSLEKGTEIKELCEEARLKHTSDIGDLRQELRSYLQVFQMMGTLDAHVSTLENGTELDSLRR